MDPITVFFQNAPNLLVMKLWSSLSAWIGGQIPAAGQLVVIGEGETVLLDIDTPILKMIIINGTSLLFKQFVPNDTVHLHI